MMHSSIPPSLMQYATMHRDERNIALHVVVIFTIILSLGILLAPMLWHNNSIYAPLGLVVLILIACIYTYYAGTLGLATAVLIAGVLLIAQLLQQWFGLLCSAFFICLAYFLHRLGHWYEGNHHLFRLRLSALFAAPLFATAEVLRRFGFFHGVFITIESHTGAPYLRDLANGSPK